MKIILIILASLFLFFSSLLFIEFQTQIDILNKTNSELISYNNILYNNSLIYKDQINELYKDNNTLKEKINYLNKLDYENKYIIFDLNKQVNNLYNKLNIKEEKCNYNLDFTDRDGFYRQPNEFIFINAYEKSSKAVCIIAMHEIAHHIWYNELTSNEQNDFNNDTEKFAQYYSHLNRC